MRVICNVIKGREHVRDSMLATQGRFDEELKTMSDEAFRIHLIGRHSTLESYELAFYLVGVPEREHTHIVRHEEIGKFVSTARPDWSDGSTYNSRVIKLEIDAKRLIEIFQSRLCTAAWKDTRKIFMMMRDEVSDPVLKEYLAPHCVFYGYCSEVRTGCNYIRSPHYERLRSNLINTSDRLVKKFKPGD